MSLILLYYVKRGSNPMTQIQKYYIINSLEDIDQTEKVEELGSLLKIH